VRPTVGEATQLSSAIYSERCVLAAAEAYKSLCSVTLTRTGDEMSLRLTVEPIHAHDAQRILDEFLNYALDLSVRAHLNIDHDA